MTDAALGGDQEQPSSSDDIRNAITAAVAESAKIGTKDAPGSPELPLEGERSRGPDGKFTTKSAPDKSGDDSTSRQAFAKADPAEKPDKSSPVTDAVSSATKPTVEPPQNWPDADKKRFKEAAPEWQTWLLDRHRAMEGDYTKKTQEIADFRKEWHPVEQLFAPSREKMKASGWTPQKLIQAWANVEDRFMRGDGVAAIKDIAKAYNIDLATVVGDRSVQQQAPQVDPAVMAALTPLQQQIAELTQAEKLRQQQAVEAAKAQEAKQLEAATNTVTAFAEAKDDKGGALHPHYSDVEADMALRAQALIAAGKTVDLQELYDYAVWANPSTREKVLSAQKQAEDQKRQDEARAKAAQAKRAGSSVTGSPTGQTPKQVQANRSIRDEIMAAVEGSAAA